MFVTTFLGAKFMQGAMIQHNMKQAMLNCYFVKLLIRQILVLGLGFIGGSEE